LASPWADLQRWADYEASASDFIHPRLRKILADFTKAEFSAAEARKLLAQARREMNRKRAEWPEAYVDRLRQYAKRFDIYLSQRDIPACERCAVAAWRHATLMAEGPDQLGAVTRAIEWLNSGINRGSDAGWIADLLGKSRAAFEAEAKEAHPNQDLVIFDLEEELAPLPREGLVVVPPLEHLPKTGRFSGEGPRAEFKAIEAKVVELREVEELQLAQHSLSLRFPWAESAIGTLLTDLVGREWVRFRPTLLVGPPGAGKSRLAMQVAKALRLPATLYSAAGASDGAFGGTSRQWNSGRASVPLQAIRRDMLANPVIVVDEIEKAGSRSENGRLWDSLVPMLEPETSRGIFDLYLECAVDLSAVSYLATANSLAGIPTPLLDRFRVLEIPAPGPEHLPLIVSAMTDEIRQERGTTELWLPDLAEDELALIAARWNGGSMRGLRRMVETLLAGRETLAARH
jgi:hypothetical protein